MEATIKANDDEFLYVTNKDIVDKDGNPIRWIHEDALKQSNDTWTTAIGKTVAGTCNLAEEMFDVRYDLVHKKDLTDKMKYDLLCDAMVNFEVKFDKMVREIADSAGPIATTD
jgi:hypothetical protein